MYESITSVKRWFPVHKNCLCFPASRFVETYDWELFFFFNTRHNHPVETCNFLINYVNVLLCFTYKKKKNISKSCSDNSNVNLLSLTLRPRTTHGVSDTSGETEFEHVSTGVCGQKLGWRAHKITFLAHYTPCGQRWTGRVLTRTRGQWLQVRDIVHTM